MLDCLLDCLQHLFADVVVGETARIYLRGLNINEMAMARKRFKGEC